MVGLSPTTTYSVSIYAIDNDGIHTASTTISITTGAATPKSDPKTLGPAAFTCSQVGTTAAVLASWNTIGKVTPDHYNVQINCVGVLGNKKIFAPGSASSKKIEGVFGKGLKSATRVCTCRLRPFYDKVSKSSDPKKVKIPLLVAKFNIVT